MVRLLKSGKWALEGTSVVDMIEGVEQSFGSVEDCKLVEARWAEWVKADAPKTAESHTPKHKAK